jgi:hypothetical protein
MPSTATRLALSMLQFIQAQPRASSPASWWIVPDVVRLRRDEVLEALDAMPKPVVLGPMVEQGMLGAWPVDAASPRGRAQIEHDLRNQQEIVRTMLDRLAPGADAVDVLLELDGDEMVFPSTELETWAREYLIMTSGWSLADSGGDPRAPVRLLLRRADGSWSPGRTRSAGRASS